MRQMRGASHRWSWPLLGLVALMLVPTVGWGQVLSGRAGSFRWRWGISASQGSSRTLSSQAPSVVLPQGGMGFFGSSIQTPFVTGIVPVVGDVGCGDVGNSDGGYSDVGYSPVQVRWRRLQRERALADLRSQPRASRTGAQPDLPAPQPPAAPAAVAGRGRVDDPPLILGKPRQAVSD